VAVLLVVLATGGVLETGSLTALASPDIWRHLSAGNWILDHRGVPHDLVFSQSVQLSWVDSSWLFDTLTAVAVKAFGLRGLPLLDMAFTFATGVALFVLARGARRRLWSGAVLSSIALYMLAGFPLRSSIASVLLFAVVLHLISVVRSSGNRRGLYSLPPLFLLWANLDIQLVYGLMALILLLIAEATGALFRQSPSAPMETHDSRISMSAIAVATAASFVATLCNPYGFRLWGAALRSVSLFTADVYIPEMHSLRFRQPQDYVLLLLVMTAFFAIGRRHARDIFSLLLLLACAIISFHLQRDSWLVAIAAVAVLAQAFDAGVAEGARDLGPPAPRWVLPAASVVALVVLLIVYVIRVPAGRDALFAKVSEKFPVRACEYIRQHDLPKPLFNSYEWGSFLTWYLPEYPVPIDNRTDAYGEDPTLGYFKLTTGQVPIEADPALSRAATILLEADSEMGKALSILPGYKQVYLDDQAMVLMREK